MTDDLDVRTLPHNLEAEKALLGGVLVQGSSFDRAATIVRPADFFRRAHRTIFGHLGKLVEARVAIDLVTLLDSLGAAGELEECGGAAYISSLADGVARSTNVAHYAAIVLEKATLRRIIMAGNAALSRAYLAEDRSVEIVASLDRELLALQRGDAGDFTDLSTRRQAIYEQLEYRHEHRGQLSGVDTGFATLNELTLGWQAGDLIVIAARPSIGKTAFTLNTAIAGARATGKAVAIFSLEMRQRQIENRLLATLSGVHLSNIMDGRFGELDFEKMAAALTDLEQLPILINDRAGQTRWDVRAACRRIRAERGLSLVIIDYVQLMHGSTERRGATRNEEITDISRGLKILADEVAAPIIVLSQLSRAGDKRADSRPILSDLRESGALEQDADAVLFLHRKHHREGGRTEAILEKQRNGPTGTVNLELSRETQTFVDAGLEPEQAALPEVPPDDGRPRKSSEGRKWRGKRGAIDE